jgi:hypothetical protein
MTLWARFRGWLTAPNPPVRQHGPELVRLLALARSQTIDDRELGAAWWCFVEALENHWLGTDLDEIIEALRARQGIGNEEFFFDFDPPGQDPLHVRFIADDYVVPTDAMVTELEELRRRYLEPRRGK